MSRTLYPSGRLAMHLHREMSLDRQGEPDGLAARRRTHSPRRRELGHDLESPSRVSRWHRTTSTWSGRSTHAVIFDLDVDRRGVTVEREHHVALRVEHR